MGIERINEFWPEWKILEEIGEGGFGKVYKAVDEEAGFPVYSAIKVLSIPSTHAELDAMRSEGLSESESKLYFKELVDNFVNEIKLMHTLKGAPNIVTVEGFKILEKKGEIGWDIYIRMELLTSFKDYLKNHTFGESEAVRLGIDIASALESCQKENIIHRDIKPANIFIDKYGHFKLGDFGIAKELEKTTGAVSSKGTYSYMAPEVARGMRYDSSVDIYSLGLVMYSLLNNNRPPFIDPHGNDVGYNQRKAANDRRLSGENFPVPCNAPPGLANVILKACSFNPAYRYKTASEFKTALKNYTVSPDRKPMPTPTPIPTPTPVSPAPAPRPVSPAPARPAPAPKNNKKGKIALIAILSIMLLFSLCAAAAVVYIVWPEPAPAPAPEPEKYKITFDPGDGVMGQTVYYIEEGSYYQDVFGDRIPVATLQGYTLDYWYCAEYDYILDVNPASKFKMAEDVTFVAKWRINSNPDPVPNTGPDPDANTVPNVGDRVNFGSYEQDNNLSNGKEAIEWRVLDKKDNKVLLISTYGLAGPSYKYDEVSTTWETSDLRSWLNSSFYNDAFSQDEKSRIETTYVRNYMNYDYEVSAGNDTEDKVFCLNLDEAKSYFYSDEDRLCYPTKYAVSSDLVWENEDAGYCSWWWLRSPGQNSTWVSRVNSYGEVDSKGCGAFVYGGAVRPCIWVEY